MSTTTVISLRKKIAVSEPEVPSGQNHLDIDRWPQAISTWRLANSKTLRSEAPSIKGEHLWSDDGLTISRIGEPTDEHYQLQFSPDIAFDVECAARLISSRADKGFPASTARHLLYDQIFPRVIAHTGSLVLHAGAIQGSGGAVLALGKSGRGKSTLVASFDQTGHRLIGDDASVISWHGDRPYITAVYPSLRLLPDSVRAVLPGNTPSSIVAHYSPKRRIDVLGAKGEKDCSTPIVAQFVIGESATNGLITLRRLTIAEACIAIIENSFALDPSDSKRAYERMKQASTLARSVPTFEITYPRDYELLPQVRQAILNTIKEIGIE